jgi:hypothetical protein
MKNFSGAGAHGAHGLHRGHEGVGGNDNLVTGPDLQRSENQLERVGPVRDPDTVSARAVLGEPRLEGLHLRTADEPAVGEDVSPGAVQLLADALGDPLDVEERDRRRGGRHPVTARGKFGDR